MGLEKGSLLRTRGRYHSGRDMASLAWFDIPKSKLGQFVYFFLSEFICFFIIVANTRAVALANYLGAAASDLAFGLQAWFMMKMTVENKDARSFAGGCGSTLGGTLGTLISIYATKHLFGA